MKKSTKLLSVILAILMIFSSLSVASFAAKTSYKTVDELKALNAYDPYGQVTRLSTEERMSILADQLDLILAQSGPNMGTVLDAVGITITLNFTSIDNVCKSIDSLKSATSNGLFKIAKAFVNLGIVEELKFDSWQSGMTRDSNVYSHLTIVGELFELITTNQSAIETVFTDGIQLGMIANFIAGLDLKPINNLIKNIPQAVKTAVFPLMARPDSTVSELGTYTNTSGDGGILSVLDNFVKIIFTKPMNWTSYRVDASGNDLGYTTALPTAAQQTSRYFVVSGDGSTITQYDYNFAPLMGSSDATGTWTETVTYTKTLEEEGGSTYLFKAPEDYTGDATLKWYTAGDKGYWLPSVRDAINNGSLSFSFNGSDSALTLLYKFIPYVFAEMAPTVLNGSVKKLLAGAFDVTFDEMTADEVTAAISATGNPDNFFTKDQEFYLWEYSDYKVIDGVPYYRFEDTYFKGTIPSNISTYYYMFNWDWNITDDFVNDYIPTVSGTTIGNSAAGYDSILNGLNAFVYHVIDTVLVDNFTVKGVTYNLKEGLGWENGGLDKVIDNILRAARYVFNIAPEEIFDEYYSDSKLSPYYNMMMNGTTKQAVAGLVAAAVKMIMPQVQFPSEAKLCKTVGTDSTDDVSVLALGAVVVRELCTQLMPAYNFDALVYADYNTKTILTGSQYDSDYWLDTVITMGIDLGMYYLRNITDLGEDSSNGYYAVMNKLGATPSADASSFTYTANSTYIDSVPTWQYKVDWIIDWALTSSEEWAWGFEKIIDCGSTVDLATYQDPWAKLNTVFLKLLPLDQVLNQSGVSTASNTWLENVLRGKLVDGINTLDLPKVASIFSVPDGILRNANVLTQVVTVVRGLLNAIVYKVMGNYTLLADNTYTTLDTILNQNNIKSLVVNLVSKLKTVSDNGLFVPILPIVGMFIGWKTGAQEYADPSIYFSNDAGDAYLHKDGTNTLKFTNKSSGMLEKHRNSDKQDQPYTIEIVNVELSNGASVSGSYDKTVAPGATVSIALTIPASDDVTRATVTYKYTGKDGQVLGGEQQKIVYARMSTVWDQENEKEAAVDTKDYWQRNEYRKYEFTKDLYDSVVNYQGSATYLRGNGFIHPSKSFGSVKYDTNPSSNFSSKFDLITNRAEAGWVEKFVDQDVTNTSGYFWKAKSGVTADTEFDYGVYDGGQIAVKYGNKSGTWLVDFIYYTDYDIGNIVKNYVDKQLKASDFGADAQDAFATYESALMDAVYYADAPKTTTYCTDIMGDIPDVITALDDAYAALSAYKKVSTNSISVDSVISAVDALETDKTHDIDFEDHELYEYFQYEKARTTARSIIKAYQKPSQPENYINGESVSQAVIEAIEAANAGNIATGIGATVSTPSDEAMQNWNDAIANWTDPTYSDLEMADAISRLNYYYSFMDANWRSPVEKQFLTKEIAAAKAQNYVQADYSTDSWAAYAAALADAEAVAANSSALQSQVFDAKYALMKAQNDLIPAYASMKDNGYLDTEIKGLIEQANTIIGHFDEYFKVKDGVDATEAWAELVKALGVEYDVTVDGVDYSGILYNRSALTYTAYDRLNTNKEKAKVDAACDKLQAALNNFVSSVTLDKTDSGVVDQVEQEVRYIQGITPGTVTTAEAILANVKASNAAAKLAVTASKSNGYGTGAKVDVSIDGIGVLTTYYVVIYGDVNGDGAVDAFDAFAVDKSVNNLGALDGVYAKAADADGSGEITVADLTPIMNAAVGYTDAISQIK